MDNTPSALGRSLQLVNGDLRFDGADFVPISSHDNFLQGMQVMIETPFGTDIFNVNYGFDLLNAISQPVGPQMVKELIRLNIVKSVSQDNRVREIKEIVFDDEPRFFEIDSSGDVDEALEASREVHRRSRRWRAVVVLVTIPEGEEVLRLEGEGL